MMRLGIVLIAVALLATGVHADVVTVSPDDTHGWDVAVNMYGLGYFTPSGIVWSETGAGAPSGRGAFYAMTSGGGISTSDKTPDTVWLGTGTHNGRPLEGVKLSQIKTMTYTAYVSDMPTVQLKEGEWKYPRQPICLQFIMVSPSGARRCMWFRPWGTKPEGDGYGGNPADQMGQWITYDCIACTPQFVGPAATIIPMWNEPQSNNQYHSWADVCAAYGDWTLAASASVGEYYHTPGWDGQTTPTGTVTGTGTGHPLNFEVGARKFQYKDIWGSSTSVNWYVESVNFKGYVDTFTLGIDFNDDGDDTDEGEKTTYDFEPAAATADPMVVGLNMKSICQGETNTNGATGPRTGNAYIWEYSGIWKKFRPRLCAQVMASPAVYQANEGIYSKNQNMVSCTYFNLTDGSDGIPVPITARVRDPQGILFNQIMWGGDYLGITGDVRIKPWGLIKMRYVWTCQPNVQVLAHP
jgi:hypothetical protein